MKSLALFRCSPSQHSNKFPPPISLWKFPLLAGRRKMDSLQSKTLEFQSQREIYFPQMWIKTTITLIWSPKSEKTVDFRKCLKMWRLSRLKNILPSRSWSQPIKSPTQAKTSPLKLWRRQTRSPCRETKTPIKRMEKASNNQCLQSKSSKP